MKKRLFFLKNDGWFEMGLSGKLLYASHEELAGLACTIMQRHRYRNYMITENPGCVVAIRGRTAIPGHPDKTMVAT
ncbi:MAG: hypothetical protein JXB19_08970 [Bacteroidales bacterium]|nr:hypothetical protein [Bacteroidales bacterium]